jgi:myosin heavy subunit
MALTGWYMQDNLTYYLDKRLNEVKQSIKDKIRAIEQREEEERKAEEYRRRQEEEREAFKQSMTWYLEEKKKLEEESRKEWARLKEEDRKRWEELRKAEEQKEAAKKAEYDKLRRLEAASDKVKSLLSSAKEIIDSADTAWFNKNPDTARRLLEEAKKKYDEAAKALMENKDILDEYDMYEALMASLEALKSILDAKALVYQGSNPTDKVRDVANKIATYAYHKGRSNARAARRLSTKPMLTIDDILALFGLYQDEVKTNVLLEQTANLMDETAKTYQVMPIEKSPLSWETIIKLRAWLASNIKTPLAKIPNYLWNKASGVSYTPDMIRLIWETLNQIPVSLAELSYLEPADIEAILRARQYLYAASKRGYFNPWEYELYCRLKRLLMLTDHQAAKLFKLYIPLKAPIKREVSASV